MKGYHTIIRGARKAINSKNVWVGITTFGTGVGLYANQDVSAWLENIGLVDSPSQITPGNQNLPKITEAPVIEYVKDNNPILTSSENTEQKGLVLYDKKDMVGQTKAKAWFYERNRPIFARNSITNSSNENISFTDAENNHREQLNNLLEAKKNQKMTMEVLNSELMLSETQFEKSNTANAININNPFLTYEDKL